MSQLDDLPDQQDHCEAKVRFLQEVLCEHHDDPFSSEAEHGLYLIFEDLLADMNAIGQALTGRAA